MDQYDYEEVACQRLRDVQREIENSRLLANGLDRAMTRARLLVRRAWWLGGLATSRPPRNRPSLESHDGEDARAASGAA